MEIYQVNKEKFKNPHIKDMNHYKALCDEFENDYEGTWGKYAKETITWFKDFDTVLDESNKPFYKWFVGGKLNVSYQCIDRHLKDKKDKTAILFESDDGETEHISYQKLYEETNKLANLLVDDLGVKKGDRVLLYMPMIPQSVYAMMACARIGAISSVVFGGFSSEAIKDRVKDAKAKVIITADGAHRKGKAYMLKPAVDEALKDGIDCLESVLVVKRNHDKVEWFEDRDICYNTLIKNKSSEFKAVEVESEDPLFLLYTSGSTGKPKGVQHSSAGYILWAQMTMQWTFDLQEDDIYWCTADIGWITGHTYIVYGPLACGGTTVMFEGVPTYPDAGRCWSMVEKYKVTQFYTAPTAIRMLHKVGEDEPKKYDLSSLRILGTVGEPIDPPAWKWYYEEIGQSNCSLVDTWWQTETGGHIITPIASATPTKPCSAAFALPGIQVEILSKDGKLKGANDKGLLCITKPWPSMIRAVWGDEQRFKEAYFSDVKKDGEDVYFSGDGALYDDDGYIFITGRVDDVIMVSGHRIGSAEVESAIKKADNVAEVAVVGKHHEIKGEEIFAYVVTKNHGYNEDSQKEDINKVIKHEIGAIAKCDEIVFVSGLPKTRSGKIMRRILKAIAKNEKITQDISTLENPDIVQEIWNIVNT